MSKEAEEYLKEQGVSNKRVSPEWMGFWLNAYAKHYALKMLKAGSRSDSRLVFPVQQDSQESESLPPRLCRIFPSLGRSKSNH